MSGPDRWRSFGLKIHTSIARGTAKAGKKGKASLEPKPWKGICTKRCWFARGDRCKCKCKGQNHGKGFQKRMIDFIGGKEDETEIHG